MSLLFTSYMVVMGLAMLVTGAVSSRLGAKRTLLIGLTIIIVGAGLAGTSDTVGGIIGFRAVWGLGNALFIATALATIVSAAKGSVGQAIVLYEAALGIGIAAGPLIGGLLGSISWRGPFFGVSALMVIALAATAVLLPSTPRAARATSLAEPFRALRHRGLLVVALTALLYNFGFFTLLAFTPFPLAMGPRRSGSSSSAGACCWPSPPWSWPRACSAASAPCRPPWPPWPRFSATLVVMAVFTDDKAVLATCVVVSGAFLGVNNTLVTETVMKAAPIERGVASAAYSFVRFGGGAVAPWLAGKLGEELNPHVPFWVGSGAVALAVCMLASGRRVLAHIDAEPGHGISASHDATEAEAVTVGDA